MPALIFPFAARLPFHESDNTASPVNINRAVAETSSTW
jgi:hypothetical protein